MKRHFYLAMTVVRKILDKPHYEIMDMWFPDSDVQDHLLTKFNEYMDKYKNPYMALLNFYEALDTEHQFSFDSWMNDAINILNAKTVQYTQI